MKITDLAILLMKREYARQGIVLPASFWNLPKYKRKFSFQMQLASKFFRTYDSEAVWNVIEREKWCFSLNAKCLPDKILEEQEKLKLEKLKEESIGAEEVIPDLPKTRFVKKNNNLFDED